MQQSPKSGGDEEDVGAYPMDDWTKRIVSSV
jgi:hypothetical protein